MINLNIEQPREIAAGITVLTIAGELDSASIEKLHAFCDEVVNSHPPYVIAEMSGVTLFSSSALGGIMGCRKRLGEKNGDLVLAGLTLDIKTKLNLLGANKIFKMYSDIRTAINAYDWEYKGKAEAVSVSFPSELKFVPPVRQLVSRIAQQKGYSSRDSFRIETIVDEGCNNAVEHGMQGSDRNIDLSVQIDREKIEIRVVNVSNPEKVENLRDIIKGNQTPAQVAALAGKRGRGLALIKMLANNLNIDFTETGTSVHITRFRGE